MNGLTFVLPLLAIAAGCLIVCLRAVREREQREARWAEHVADLAAGDRPAPTGTGRGMRLRVLDLFCCAGGAARGYHDGFTAAGFDVDIIGVDIEFQQSYPYTFVQADAMTYPLDGFDFIHASPPCQHYAAVTAWRGSQADHADLLAPTRDRLRASGATWVIENVPGAPLRADYLLCGSAFGLRVRRHRLFETSWRGFAMSPPCRHAGLLPFMHKGERAYADAMGCDWMTSVEARQAIPPAYTAFLAEQIAPALMERAA